MMKCQFRSHEIPERDKGLTFDDVLLIPKHSQISSRRTPNLEFNLTKNHLLQIPIISSNMDTITEENMAMAMAELGGLGILHRFMSTEDQVLQVRSIKARQNKRGLKTPLAASIGVQAEAIERAQSLSDEGVEILVIDIAHGDSILMLETLQHLKKNLPHIQLIAGNVAMPEGVRRLIDHGADAVKVGIGPGSMCTTRLITGCGVPQLTALSLCAAEAKRDGISIIADGGLRYSGDIVKALCAGAHCVMLGSMLSGTLETPGLVKGGMKKYRGMASKAAQVSWRGELPQGMAPEGVETTIPCKGSVVDVLGEITGGIRSGMTYLNALTLSELPENALFMEVSSSSRRESTPHGYLS